MRVDYDLNGAHMGIEITAPMLVGVDDVNAILRSLGQPEVPSDAWAPLHAA